MWKTLDEKTLKSKKVVELREIAKTFGLQGYEKMKKADLIANLMREDPKEENSNKDDHDKSVHSRDPQPGSNHEPREPRESRDHHEPREPRENRDHHEPREPRVATTVSKWKAFLNWQKMDSDSLDLTTF